MVSGRQFTGTIAPIRPCDCAERPQTAFPRGAWRNESVERCLMIRSFRIAMLSSPFSRHWFPPRRPTAAAATRRIGYVYPAGGRQGTTFQVTIGGQNLDGAAEVFVSGGGVGQGAASTRSRSRPSRRTR